MISDRDDTAGELERADNLFGRLAVQTGLAEAAEIERARRDLAPGQRLAQRLVELGQLSRDQMHRLLRLQGQVLRRLRTVASASPETLESEDERFAQKLLLREAVTLEELLDAIERQTFQETPTPLRRLLTEAEPPPEAPEGPRRFGKYEILDQLGAGGMGRVYRVRDTLSGRLLALKVMRAGEDADQRNLARFQQEARILARLDHPNLVPIYEFGFEQSCPYYTMPVVPGEPLSRRLTNCTRLDPGQASRIVATLARALATVHQAGYLHRDLKPSNIMIDEEDRPRLIDFGIAKALDQATQLTRTAEHLGTPAYMAPEQVEGDRQLDARVDVYALGVILFQSLTGRTPYGGDYLQVLWAISEQEAPSPGRIQADVPPALDLIVQKCMARERAERYDDANALADDLERFLRGEAPLARPRSLLARGHRLLRRHALLAVVFLMLCLGMTALAIYWVGEAELARRRWRREGRQGLSELKEALARKDWDQAAALTRYLDDREFRPAQGKGLPQRTLAGAADRAALVERARIELAGASSAATSEPPAARVGLESSADREEYVAIQGLPLQLSVLLPPGRQVSLPSDRQLTIHYTGRLRHPWRWSGALRKGPVRLVPLRLDVGQMPGRWRVTAAARWHGTRLLFEQQELQLGNLGQVKPEQVARFLEARRSSVARQLETRKTLLGHLERRRASTAAQLARWQARYRHISRMAAERWRRIQLCRALNEQYERARLAALEGRHEAARSLAGGMRHQLTGLKDSLPPEAYSALEQGLILIERSGPRWQSMLTRLVGRQIVVTTRDGQQRKVLLRAWLSFGLKLAQPGSDEANYILPWERLDIEALWRHDLHAHRCYSSPWGLFVGASGSLVTLEQIRRSTGLVGHKGEAIDQRSAPPTARFAYEGQLLEAEEVDRLGLYRWKTRALRLSGLHRLGLLAHDGSAFELESFFTAEVWRRQRSVQAHQGAAPTVAFSPDGRWVATGGADHAVRVWDAASGKSLRTLLENRCPVESIAVDPEGKLLASAGTDGRILLWNTRDWRRKVTLIGHRGAVRALAFSRDRLASGGDDRTIRLWSLAGGPAERVFTGHSSPVRALAFSPNGFLLVSGSREIRIWGATSGMHQTFPGHAASTLAYGPDGRWIATGGTSSAVQLWQDTPPWQLQRRLSGHQQNVTAVTFSSMVTRDSGLLASGSRDGAVRVWRISTGKRLMTLEGHGKSVLAVAFAPDSRTIVSTDAAGRLLFWGPAR